MSAAFPEGVTDHASLVAWVERKLIGANNLKPTEQMELLREIRAVTDAFSKDTPDAA